jgi:hypothetical protein
MKRMEDHGLKFYTAIGDHEIGGAPGSEDSAALAALFKRQFQRYLNMPRNGPLRMKGTAFSVVHENTLLVALDEFERGTGPQAGIVPQVTGEQLQWLEQTLAENPGVSHVVAIGHMPVLPPALPPKASGRILTGSRQSPLWQTLQKHSVDLYLCGGTKAIGCAQADGILQIAHGGLATMNYAVAAVYPDRIDLELKEIALTREDGPTPPTGPSEKIRIAEDAKSKGFTTVGTASLHRDRTGSIVSNATGCFARNP